MNKDKQLLNIPFINKETDFWMIRTKKGCFFDEFVDQNYIAIGWNCLTKSIFDASNNKDHIEELKTNIKMIYNEKQPGAAFNKCYRFIYGMKPDDIVVIVDNNRLAFAFIGEYFEEKNDDTAIEAEMEIHTQISHSTTKSGDYKCPYIKRRKISVIKVIDSRDTIINPYLQNAFTNNRHSLSCLNSYAELILSSCFDAFVYEEKLTLVFRVKQEESINVCDLSNFVVNAADVITGGNPEQVCLKTNLHSPGDVLLQVWNFAQENWILILICYLAVFGGKFQNIEFHSIISIIEKILNRDYRKELRENELRKSVAEADLAEQQALEKRIENIERLAGLNLKEVEPTLKLLAESAEKLKVEPSKEKVEEIKKIIDEEEKIS